MVFFLPPCDTAWEGVSSCICHMEETIARVICMHVLFLCVVHTREHVFPPVFCMSSVLLLVITLYLRLEHWIVWDCSTQEGALFPRLAAGLHDNTDVSSNVGSGWSAVRHILDWHQAGILWKVVTLPLFFTGELR